MYTLTHMSSITLIYFQMYGDTLENLEVITLDLIDDMLTELKMSDGRASIDVYPIVHKCTTSIITSIVRKCLHYLKMHEYDFGTCMTA